MLLVLIFYATRFIFFAARGPGSSLCWIILSWDVGECSWAHATGIFHPQSLKGVFALERVSTTLLFCKSQFFVTELSTDSTKVRFLPRAFVLGSFERFWAGVFLPLHNLVSTSWALQSWRYTYLVIIIKYLKFWRNWGSNNLEKLLKRSWELFIHILKIFWWKPDESSWLILKQLLKNCEENMKFLQKKCEEMWDNFWKTASVQKLRKNLMEFW